MEKNVQSVDEVVEEIMRLHRSLPPRPDIDQVEAATTLVQNVDTELQARVEVITKQRKNPNIPEELFMIMQEMRKNLVFFQSKEQKREALKLIDIEDVHALFDDFIQRASNCVPSSSSSSSTTTSTGVSAMHNHNHNVSSVPKAKTTSINTTTPLKTTHKNVESFTRDDSCLNTTKSSFYSDGIGIGNGIGIGASSNLKIRDSSLKPGITSGQNGEKLSLIKLASAIEVAAKKGTEELNLQSKLMDSIEWLPESIGKLSSLVTLDLSENRIIALPNTLGGLSSLSKLDLRSNRILQLPESVGDLLSLVSLDLAGNQLSSLPATFGKLLRLEELDLCSNSFTSLPDSIGQLVNLKKLLVETNNIEEIPHVIGMCTNLKELRAAYNRLKALPEAVGKIETLEVLSVRYNNIKQLPTTMSSLVNLKELDVSFNELESVPESLCFATTLVKLNVGNNFADLRSLPRSIGNLEMLEELNVSNNQIRIFPESFRMLTRLRVLHAEENPLEVPPRSIAEKGAQAVVQYMIELTEKKDVKPQPVKQRKSWAQICCFSRSNKRKRDGMDYVKA